MEPTLYSKNVLLTERISARFCNPKRGEIIIAISPTNPKQFICKRIIGLPGDRIVSTTPAAKKEDTDKNKKDSEEERFKYDTTRIMSDVVPRGYIWVEGDNRDNSADSRYYGPIPFGLVKSRVVCRLWPLNEMKFLM